MLIPITGADLLIEGIVDDGAKQRRRAAALQTLVAVRAGIEVHVGLNMLLVHSVACALAREPGMEQGRYGRMVAGLMEHSVDVHSIRAAPDLVVRLVYPLAGNEAVVGLDYRRDPRHGPRAIEVARGGAPALVGPLPLRRGGLGVIIHHPIPHTDGEDRIGDGLVSLVLDIDRLYHTSGLTALLARYRIALRGADGSGAGGAVFFGDPSVLDADPIRLEVALPGGSWELAAVPKGGWGMGATVRWGIRAAALLGIALASLAGWLVLDAHARLRRVAASLGESEALQRSLLASLPDLIWMKDADGVYLACNPRFEQFFGACEAEIVGRSDADFLTPEQVAFFRGKDQDAIAAGGPTRNEEWITFASDGHRELLETVKTPVHGDDGALIGVLCIGRDITARHEAEKRIYRHKQLHALIAATNRRIVRLRDPERIYADVCAFAVETGGLSLAWIGLVDDDQTRLRPVARAGNALDYLDQIRVLPRGDGPLSRGPTGRAIRDGRHQVSNDIATDERMLPWRDAALARGLRASAAFPLRVGGRVRGAFSVYADAAGFFDAAVLELLDDLASALGLALELSESDASRRQAEAELQASEERFRALVEHSMMGIYMVQDKRVAYVNPRFAEIYGYDGPQAMIGLSVTELIAPEAREGVLERLRRRESGEVPSMHYESMARRLDGSRFPIEVYGSRIQLNDRPAIIGSMLDISERREALRQLADSRARLTNAEAIAHVGHWEFDYRDGRILWSDETYRIFGMEPGALVPGFDDLIGRIHPEDRAAHAANMERIAASRPGEPIEPFRYRLRRPDGSERSVIAWCEVAYGEDHRPQRLFGAVQDLTELREAQARASHREAVLESVFRALPDLFFLMDADGSIREYRAGRRELLTMPLAQFVGRRMDTLLPEAVGRRFAEAFDALRAGGGLASFEYDLTVAGAQHRFEARLNRLEAGGQLVAVIRDISEPHRARRALAESEVRYRGLFDAMSDGVVVYRTLPGEDDFIIADLNPAAVRITGIPREQAVGRRLRTLFPAVDALGLLPLLLAVAADGEPSFHPISRYTDDRLDLWVENAVFRLPTGEVVAVFNDVTERRRAELAVRQLNAELEQRVVERTLALTEANRELETFAYSVSHDLKAPLRAIDGYSRLLLEDHADRLDDEGRGFLANVRIGVAHMGELIEDLLAYSRMDRAQLRCGFIDLHALIDEVVAARREAIDAAGARVQCRIEVDAIETDADALALVLRNLLDNALKFHGDAPPQIEIAARRGEESIILKVTDQGIGFDMSFHDRIFDVFQRLQHSDTYPGTGVGLALVRRAVQRMGGRVRAESAPGQGASFIVELPG